MAIPLKCCRFWNLFHLVTCFKHMTRLVELFSTKTSFILGEIPFSYYKSKLLYYLLTTNCLAVLLFNLGEIHLKRQCDSLKEDRHFQGTFDMLWNHVPYPDVLLVWILDMYIKLKHSSVYIHVIDERLSIVVVALFLENHRGQPSYQRGQETQRCTRTGWSGRVSGFEAWGFDRGRCGWHLTNSLLKRNSFQK